MDNNQSEKDDLTHFQIHATSHDPIHFSGMPLEYLSLDLQASASQTHVEKTRLWHCRWKGIWKLFYSVKNKNGSELDIKLSVQKANRSSFAEVMDHCRMLSPKTNILLKKSNPRNSAVGF